MYERAVTLHPQVNWRSNTYSFHSTPTPLPFFPLNQFQDHYFENQSHIHNVNSQPDIYTMSTVSLKQSPNSGFSNSRKAHVTTIFTSLLPFSYRNFLHAIYLEAIKFKFINNNQQQLTINQVCINFQKIPFIKYSIKTSQPPHEVGTIIILTLQMKSLRYRKVIK